NASQDVSDMQRTRSGPRFAGIFFDSADLPAMPWFGKDHSPALRDLRRRGSPQKAQDAVGENPGGSRPGRPNTAFGGGRSGDQRRSAGRLVRRRQSQASRGVPAPEQ